MERRIDTGVASRDFGAMTVALVVAGLCGCAALPLTPDMSNITNPGSVFTGFMTAKSTIKLNRANEQLSRAQVQIVTQQAIDLELKREQLKQERPVKSCGAASDHKRDRRFA